MPRTKTRELKAQEFGWRIVIFPSSDGRQWHVHCEHYTPEAGWLSHGFVYTDFYSRGEKMYDTERQARRVGKRWMKNKKYELRTVEKAEKNGKQYVY